MGFWDLGQSFESLRFGGSGFRVLTFRRLRLKIFGALVEGMGIQHDYCRASVFSEAGKALAKEKQPRTNPPKTTHNHVLTSEQVINLSYILGGPPTL